MTLSRRGFLAQLGATAAVSAATSVPAKAVSISFNDLRGGYDASQSGLRPGAVDDQSKIFQQVLNSAAAEDKPVFLPPGLYQVSNIVIPSRTRLMGVPGASKLVYSGGGHFLMAENADFLEFTGLVIDGVNRPINEYAAAGLRVINAKHVAIDNCEVVGCREIGIEIDRSSGRIERSKISGASGNAGIFALENKGLIINNNRVEDCANAGIMVYRWQRGEDNTIVTGNRVARIAAAKGGTGPWGNGINTYQADNVMVTNNHVSDCAFSTIRSNSCDNIQITGNTCLRAGETSVYSEFAFNGAMVSNNIIDGGARGISIVNLDHGGRLAVCSNNLIRNIKDTAPYKDENHLFGDGISAEADISITGNVIERTARFGMKLGWGHYLRNLVASNNVIRNTGTGFYVTVVEGTGNASITGNLLSDIRESGITGYRWREAVTGDMAKSGAGSYSNLTIENNTLSY